MNLFMLSDPITKLRSSDTAYQVLATDTFLIVTAYKPDEMKYRGHNSELEKVQEQVKLKI